MKKNQNYYHKENPIVSMEKPNKEKYGWHNQDGFDDEPTGWLIEGGEEAYFEALKRWQYARK